MRNLYLSKYDKTLPLIKVSSLIWKAQGIARNEFESLFLSSLCTPTLYPPTQAETIPLYSNANHSQSLRVALVILGAPLNPFQPLPSRHPQKRHSREIQRTLAGQAEFIIAAHTGLVPASSLQTFQLKLNIHLSTPADPLFRR